MKKIAIYCRTAQESPEAIQLQKKQVLEAITVKLPKMESTPVLEFFEDDGYSGLDLRRPGYKALLQEIEKGEIDAVAVTDVTRIGRSSALIYGFITLLGHKGIRLISLQRDYEPGKALPEARARYGITIQI